MSVRARVAAGVSVLAVLVAGLASCSDGDDDPTPGGDDASAALRIGVPAPASYDTVDLSPGAQGDLIVADLLYDGLTARGDDGAVEPSLATEWTASADLRTWTFTLREGATFADGSALDAAAVKRSLEHVASAGDRSFTAVRLDVINGFAELAAGDAEELSGVRAVDATTLEIALSGPVSVLPALFSTPLLGITKVDAAASAVPVASGSFEVESASADRVELRPRTDDVAVEGIELRLFTDAEAAYAAFEDGDLDVAPIPAESYDDAVDDHGDDAVVPFHAELLLAMNLQTGAFRNATYREAISLAIDREQIVDEVYSGTAEPLERLVPAAVTGRGDAVCEGLCDHDPDRAKELVAGLEATPKVVVDVDDSPAQRRLAELVVEHLADVGIPAQARRHAFDEYTTFAASGNQQLFSFGWIGLYDSPDAYLAPLLLSNSADNVTSLRVRDIDAALRRARASDDPDTRQEAWAEAERRALRARALVPIAQFRVQLVVADRVEGVEPRTDGTFDVTAVQIG